VKQLDTDWARFKPQSVLRTGATGLEPATSGVTGHFEDREVDDGGHRIALFMRLFGVPAQAPAWLSKRRRDVCCPYAARPQDQRGMLKPCGTSSAESWWADMVVVVAQAK
jgi:hypothetical protein